MATIKFIGTDYDNEDYSVMIANTVLNTSRWELELPVLAVIPKYMPEGEELESAFTRVIRKSRMKRLAFDIEFVPFITVPDDEYENTTEKRMQLYEQIFDKKAVWLAHSGNDLPRWDATTGLNRVKDKLPVRVEPDFAEPSIDKDNSREELTITLQQYRA